MGLGHRNFLNPPCKSWRAPAELGQKVSPLMEQLSSCLWDPTRDFPASDFRGVEAIAAALRFGSQAGQERGDAGARIRLRLESSELRVVTVAPGSTRNDFLSEQGLTPDRDQAFRVEVLRMECPKSHWEPGESPIMPGAAIHVEHKQAGPQVSIGGPRGSPQRAEITNGH